MNTKLVSTLLWLSCIIGVYKAQTNTSKINPPLLREIHNNKIQQLDVFIKGNIPLIQEFLNSNGGTLKYAGKSIAAISIPLSKVQSLAQCSYVERIEYKKNNLQPLDDSSLRKNNVLDVHKGKSPLVKGYTGKNVIIGIIDTGTDYKHPDFKDSTGKSRIRFLWDQRSANNPASPKPFNYGIEWTKEKIDSNLCTHTDNTAMGHGTKVAGVAAGNGRSAAKYKGIAPDADIITVAIDFNSPNAVVMDGIQYIVNKATLLGKPFVINISLGDYFGSHDGKDLESQLAESLMSGIPGRVLVTAAGNSGNIPIHLGYTLSNDSNFTWLTNNTNSIYFQVYADTANFSKASYAFGLHAPNFNYIGHSPFRQIKPVVGLLKTDTIKVNGKRYGIVESIADSYNGLNFLEVLITADSLNYFWTFETTGSGKFDAWSNDFKSINLPSSYTFPKIVYYKKPDTYQSICGGLQCSDKIITVANYTDRLAFHAIGNNLSTFPGVNDSLFENSSIGPTRDGRLKPDIAATGENIATTGSSGPITWLIQNYPNVVTADSLHMIFGGTSAASPAVAGFAALYLEKNPTATAQMIRNDIMNCAKKDNYTGMLNSVQWGHGKLDAYNALLCNNTVDIKSASDKNELLYQVFPNPVLTELNVVSNTILPAMYLVYDAQGRLCQQGKLLTNYEKIKTNQLTEGIYLLQFIDSIGNKQSVRFVKQ